MSGSRYAAIVFASVDVLELAPDCLVAFGNILFFDVGVEGIKKNADIRVANFLRKPGSVRGLFRK